MSMSEVKLTGKTDFDLDKRSILLQDISSVVGLQVEDQ